MRRKDMPACPQLSDANLCILSIVLCTFAGRYGRADTKGDGEI